MGNPHLMEFERVISAESRFIDGYLSTREFVRAVGLSAEYKRRFFETSAPYRFIELNFKHFLGRAPQSQAEISEHTKILAEGGYEAEISSYVDSQEYQNTFGEDTVPFARILTEEGRSQVDFNRQLSLAEGYAASDTVLNSSALVSSVATGLAPSGWRKPPAGPTAPEPNRVQLIPPRSGIALLLLLRQLVPANAQLETATSCPGRT